MAESLISSLTEMLDQVDAHRIARSAEASEEQIRRGYRAAVTSILAGISAKIPDAAGLRLLLDVVASRGGNTLQIETGPPSFQRRRQLLSMLFGDREREVVEKASRQTLLPCGVMDELMGLAAPAVLSALGTRMHERGISLTSVPTGILKPVEISNHPFASPAGMPIDLLRRGWTWVAIIAGLLLLMVLCRERAVSVNKVTASEVAAETTRSRTLWPELGSLTERKLPGGVYIRVPENGLEAHFMSYIEDSSRRAGVNSDHEFDFDRLYFDTNSAIPGLASADQLSSIAAILKAYRTVRLEIGAYTDSQGDRRANLRLSENRAEAVKRELVGMDVNASRLEAKGYGDQHAVANNAAGQSGGKYSRISLRVLHK